MMDKTTQSEPKAKRESSPKHSGYGTDMIGGGGQKQFSRGVMELERQGMEHHHMVDQPGHGEATNSGHKEHVKGHTMKELGRK